MPCESLLGFSGSFGEWTFLSYKYFSEQCSRIGHTHSTYGDLLMFQVLETSPSFRGATFPNGSGPFKFLPFHTQAAKRSFK